MHCSRRSVLAGTATTLAGLAGCSGLPGASSGDPPGKGGGDAGPTPPLAPERRHLGHPVETLDGGVLSGGQPKDGIPSIDQPRFESAASADQRLDDGSVVFGVARNGEAKAYPQYILVHHEIANDTVGGDPVSVTYCPLTGTAMGFLRGPTTFGVSGNLLNSNLVMYDRATDSRWPQILATAIDGPLAGRSLQEFSVPWTTWKRWREAHPDTRVLTQDTGHVRNYGADPYGDYDPPAGYYASERVWFDLLATDDRFHPKAVFVGVRTATGAAAVRKQALRERRVLSGAAGETPVVAAHDPALDVGHVYANHDRAAFTAAPDGVRGPEGAVHPPDDLPLPPLVETETMWFPWPAFYPEGTVYAGT